jgi:hypothetical protein
MGSMLKLPSQALCRALVPRPSQPHLQQPISQISSLILLTVPPLKKRVTEKAMMNPCWGHHPYRLLVMKVVKPTNWPAADSAL